MVIAEAPPFSALPPQWLCMRVDHEREIHAAVQLLTHNESILGIHLFPVAELPLWKLFKEGYIRVKAAGGVVLDEQGRLLAIRRLGKWDLPKGKVEKDEAIDAAALREVQEECGIQELQLLEPLMSTWHTYARNGKQHLKRTEWFLMRSSSKETLVPQTEEDIEEVRWFSTEEAAMLKADTYPSLLPVIEVWERLDRL